MAGIAEAGRPRRRDLTFNGLGIYRLETKVFYDGFS
jgi:hypothetical protein